MASSAQREIARRIIREHGRTYAEEAGIRLDRHTPAPLFQLLVLALLLSARLPARNGVMVRRAA